MTPHPTTVAARSRATSSWVPAIAYCQGTPLREIEARDASRFGDATVIAAEDIAKRFGRAAVDGKIQARIAAPIPGERKRVRPQLAFRAL